MSDTILNIRENIANSTQILLSLSSVRKRGYMEYYYILLLLQK